MKFIDLVNRTLRSISIAPAPVKRRRRHSAVYYETLEVRAMLDGDGDGDDAVDDDDGDSGGGDLMGETPQVVVGGATAALGCCLQFQISWSGAGSTDAVLAWSTTGETNSAHEIGSVTDSAGVGDSGSITVSVPTTAQADDIPFMGDSVVLQVILSADYGTVSDANVGGISGGQPVNCNCSCDCNNVEPQVLGSGRTYVNSGQGYQPQDLDFNGNDLPHPIVSVDDTLAAASEDSEVVVQTAVRDLPGDGSPVWTSSAADYSPMSYTGQPVEFSTMLDGSGWSLRNVDHLVPQNTGVTLEGGNGENNFFNLLAGGSGDNQYQTPGTRPDIASLVQNTDDSFTLTYRDGSSEDFSSTGLETSQTDTSGNQTLFDWNTDGTLHTVTSQQGTTTFAYSSGHLGSVTDFAGRETDYGFTSGKLTSITLPAPGDSETQHVTTIAYSSTTGMPTTITDEGGTTTLSYNSFRQVTSIEEPDGTTTSYSAPSGASLGASSLVYAASVQGSKTDASGTSYYTVDPATGLTTSTTDAAATNTTYFQYNDLGLTTQISQPPLTTGGSRLVTTMSYDGNGNMLERDLPDATSESWVYSSTWNKPTQYTDPAGRETDYVLDSSTGDVLTVTQVGTGGDSDLVTHYTYTPAPTSSGDPPAGLVATIIDPRGIETDLSYTSFGKVSEIVYAVGTADEASVSFTYNDNQDLTSYTNELGLTTNYVVDAMGRTVEEQDPPPDPSTPSVRPTWTWVFDTRGNMLSQIDPMDRLTSYVYGAGSDGDEPDLDQMIEPDPAGGTSYTVTTYGHDNAENVTSITDSMSRLESIGLDADNRQTSVTLPNPVGGGAGGPSESVVYNALGFAVQQFDLMGSETDNTFNWRGQVLTTTGPAPTPGAQRPTETLSYNNDGEVLTDQNPLLATTQYVYNSFGERTEEILPDPDGSGPLTSPTLHWGYDGDGNVASYQDGNGNVYTYSYNARNELVQEDDPSPDGGVTPGPVWQWQYNAAGELSETIDPMNRVTQFVHDGDGNVIQTIAPNLSTGGAGDASTTTYDTFDLANERTSETTPNGATTSWQFNDLGQMVKETDPVPVTGESAPVWQFQYDTDNELTQETNPLGLTQVSTFNGMGQMTGQTSFAGVQTAWTYNNLSEILTTTTGTGSLAQTMTNTWDALGRNTSVQDANGTTSMAFDLAGRMTSLTDPDQNQTVWTRDNLGRVISEQDPSGTETFAYDANSNLVKQVDFKGQERDFVFDDLNRETAEKWMSGSTVVNTIATAYNADGEVTSTGDSFSNYAFGYDGQGNVTSVDNAGTPGAPHVVLNSQFNAQGERTSLAATIAGTADFINSYGFDDLSRVNQIDQQGQSGGNAVAAKSVYLGLDGVGDITGIYYSNLVGAGPEQNGPGYATLSYDPATGLLAGINDVSNGTSLDNLTYTYDPLGRVSTFASIDGTATYGYDHTSQLVSATYTTASGGHQPANVSFTWDANGNNAATGNVVSANNEVTNDGTFTYQFDSDGNRTSRTRISSDYATDYKTTYTWDYRNRLTDVETFDNGNALSKHVHYKYDVYDNLIEEDIDPTGGGSYTTVDQFALDVSPKLPVQVLSLSGTIDPSAPDDTLLEFINGALAYRLLNGPSPSGADAVYAEGAVDSLLQPDVPDWVFVNNQGSPTEVVDSSGNLIDHEVYSPFGQVAYVSNAGVFVFQGYAGGIADPNTGLIKFGERWYDPLATVWISVDPAGFRAGDPNLRRYVGNSPQGMTDPSGYMDAITYVVGPKGKGRVPGIVQGVRDSIDSFQARIDKRCNIGRMEYSYSLREFLADLRKAARNGKGVDGIVIKGHGSPGIITDEDGATFYVSNEGGVQRVVIIWPDNSETDITGLLRAVTDSKSSISLRACTSAGTADDLAQILGDGVHVSGIHGLPGDYPFSWGIPFTDAAIGCWSTYSYPDPPSPQPPSAPRTY